MIVDIKWRILEESLADGELYVEIFYVIDEEEKIYVRQLYNKRGVVKPLFYDKDGFIRKSDLCSEDFFDYYILLHWDEIVTEAKKILIKEML